MRVFRLDTPAGPPDPEAEGGLRPGLLRAPAVTTGVFDGVHRGHQKVIEALRAWAAEPPAGETVILTFDRHPRVVLGQGEAANITSVDHRLRLFAAYGIDAAVVLHFDERTAAIEPERFVSDILVGRIGARKVMLGEDHRFGRDRRGDLALLERLGAQAGFAARAIDLEIGPGIKISSSAVRAAIREGRLADAADLLGRPVSVVGDVVTGDRRGRTLGFPTANLDLHHETRPPRGVYVATAAVLPPIDALPTGPLPAPTHLAVVNIGRRPTFHPEAEEDLVEVHLLGFDREIVGEALEVTFVERLRDERRFGGPEELKAQIARDRDAAVKLAGERGLPRPC